MTEFSPGAIVFDFDGTLIDSLPFVLRAFTHALAPFVPKLTMEVFATLGGPPERTFPHFLGGVENLPEALRRLVSYNEENEHSVRPFGGASEILAALHARGIALGIWTGRDRVSTLRMIRQQGWGNYISAICCGDDLPSHKPDPAGLQKILAEVGVPPSRALMVGDANVDIDGAASAGVRSLLISHGRELPEHFLASTWRWVVSPADAFGILRNFLEAGTNTPE